MMKTKKTKRQARVEIAEQLLMYFFVIGMVCSIIYNIINH